MSRFLQRNRKKGLLAALLFLFGERKAVTALLLVAVIFSFVFIAPSNFTGGAFAGTRAAAAVAWVAAKLGLGGVFGLPGAGSFAGVLEAFRSAQRGRDHSWNAIFGHAAASIALANRSSSVALVKGDPADFGIIERFGRGPKSIRGVLTAEEAGKTDSGVALDAADLRAVGGGDVMRVVRGPNAYVGPGGGHVLVGGTDVSSMVNGFGRGGGANDSSGAGLVSGQGFGRGGGANDSSGAGLVSGQGFGPGASAGTRVGDKVQNAFSKTEVAKVKGGKIIAASPGRLSRMAADKISSGLRQAMNRNYLASGNKALVQLADGNARALMARTPLCSDANGCPSEYAATNTGAIYDGNIVGPSAPEVITAPPVDGATNVGPVPSDAQLQQFINEAKQTEEDAEKCKASNARYGPEEQSLSAELQKKGQELQSMGCGSGGCSQSKYERCMAKGDEMKAVCYRLNSVQCAHIMACPFTAPDGCPPPDCNR